MKISAINNDLIYNRSVLSKQKQQKKELSFNARFINGMKRPRHVKPFIAMQNFSRYNPLQINFGTYTIPVHNEGISQKLKPKYNLSEFNKLYEFAKSKGTFDYIMDSKTGFIKTSFINHKENPLMSDLIWITDSCHNMCLAKRKNPKSCTAILDKLTVSVCFLRDPIFKVRF